MAKINRFFNPSLSGYQSQFVPMELPADLMLKGLLAKQAKADEITNKVNILAEYDQRALGWHDTEYVKGFKNKAQLLQDQAMQTDVTDPDFQRSYFNLARELKTDEGLKKVANAVSTHDQYMDRYKELVKKGAHADAEALRFSYETRLGEYTKEGGRGFTGEIQLGNPLTTEGLNIQEGLEKLFNDIKSSGSEQARSFKDALGAKYSYETGFEGVTDKRVQQQLNNIKNNLLDSPEGKQLRDEALMKLDLPDFKYEKLSKEERNKVDGQIENYIMGKALAVGKEFIYGKSSSNLAEAQQKANDRDFAEALKVKENAIVTTTIKSVEENADLTWDGQIKKINDANASDWNELYKYKKNPNYMTPQMANEIKSRIAGRDSRKVMIQQDKNKAWNQLVAKHPEELQKLNKLKKELGIATDAHDAELMNQLFQSNQGMDKMIGGSDVGWDWLTGIYSKSGRTKEQVDLAKKKIIDFKKSSPLTTEWQKTYYPEKSNTSLANINVTSAPNSATSKADEYMINRKTGFSFYDTNTGKLIPSNEIVGDSYKIAGYTNEDFKGKGIGRAGTVKVAVRKPAHDNKGNVIPNKFITEYQNINVVATSNNPNDRNTQLSLVRDYRLRANQLRSMGKLEEAANAESMSLDLVNPGINDFFKQVGQTTSNDGRLNGTLTSKPIKVAISDGNKVSDVNFKIVAHPSGEYELIDQKTGVQLMRTTDYTDIKYTLINANLGEYGE